MSTGLSAETAGRGEPLSLVRPVRVAVNQVIADAETPLHAGDEVAFLPPVTGG